MTRLWLGASLVLCTAVASILAAQEGVREKERAEEAAPRVRVYERQHPHAVELARFSVRSRPRIGVTIAMGASDDNRTGARIESVTPDGPAAKVGLQKGDIITKFGETSLGGDEDNEPGRKLVELARELEPGDTVKVEYRRGGDRRTATIVAEDLGTTAFGMSMPTLRSEFRQLMPTVDELRNRVTMYMGSPTLNLTTLNPGLGEYFGATEGVLVLEAPADTTMPLRAGDVIVSIDGRNPESESHARRILGSYAPGEAVTFEVMRQRQRQTLEWTVPEHTGVGQFRGMHREPLTRPRARVERTRQG